MIFFLENKVRNLNLRLILTGFTLNNAINKSHSGCDNRTQSAECDEILRFECGVRCDAMSSIIFECGVRCDAKIALFECDAMRLSHSSAECAHLCLIYSYIRSKAI